MQGEEREGRPAGTNYGRLSGIITVWVSAADQDACGRPETQGGRPQRKRRQ